MDFSITARAASGPLTSSTAVSLFSSALYTERMGHFVKQMLGAEKYQCSCCKSGPCRNGDDFFIVAPLSIMVITPMG